MVLCHLLFAFVVRNERKGMAQKAYYMLRRNLPLWKPEKTIAETLAFCERTGVEEIIWKIDPEDFNHGFTPHAMIREFLPWLKLAKIHSLEKNIRFSINPWVALNHDDRGRYPSGPPEGFHWRVNPYGKDLRERACPLSGGWRNWFFGAYRLYAGLQPAGLWVEDEFRTYETPLEIGCFCPKHLEKFGQTIGTEISRKELVDRILKPGIPDPLRGRWMDFQGEIMVEVCRDLERNVHEVSPETRLGLMQSWSTDGRWWSEALRVLAGPHRPLCRTSLAPYQETRSLAFLPDNFDILKEMACLPPEAENCPELENFKYTSFSKSVRTTRLQILLSQILGNPSITMNLFDMLGTPIANDPRIEKMLREIKPVLDALAETMEPEGKSRGVSVPFTPRYADFNPGDPDRRFHIFQFDGEGWMIPLQGSGIPVILNGESSVSAVTGNSLRALPPGQIQTLLQKGLLLDGSAAKTLGEMGYAEKIGLTVRERISTLDLPFAAEKDRLAPEEAYMTAFHLAEPFPGYVFSFDFLPGTQVASSFVDPDRKDLLPALMYFENDLGGRVAVYAGDLSGNTTCHFMNWHRKRQLQHAIRWLAKDVVDLFVDGGAWMMPLRRDYPDSILIAVLNFETDPWEEVSLTLDLPSAQPQFQLLRGSGTFEPIKPTFLSQDGKKVSVRFAFHVPALDFAVFKIL
jgi:hypothetical protein